MLLSVLCSFFPRLTPTNILIFNSIELPPEYQKQQVIMQYGEYEIKVRDATGNEPWGASSKLMLEIAEATHHYQGFNETMETILKR